ncbi:hypothetical protein MMC28_002461 [Mycoblastus sanguinarius]|nr:hypothetical protein [Mycoblastus sanguinarius]
MPGSFSFENTLPPKLDIRTGAKSHFFQPPRTPSASSSLYRSTASLSSQDATVNASRKRSWHDSLMSNHTAPDPVQSHVWPSTAFDQPSTSDTSGTMSPTPFVNTQYKLAGGFDTPTAGMHRGAEDYQASPDLHLRGGRGSRGYDLTDSDSYFPQPSLALAREMNGRPRIHRSPRFRDGLGRAVYTAVGVAGRVWEFCRTSAFRGFYAGGGQGYEMKPSLQSKNYDQIIWQGVQKDDVFRDYDRPKSLIPGHFPEEDFIPDYMSQNHAASPRVAKKIQREKGGGEISASWVMVGSTPTSRESSPSRLSSRKVPTSNTLARRPIPKLGRRPILPASRPSLTSYAGSPSLRADHSASFASARSPMTSPKHESPVSVKVQRHAAKTKKRELEDDANLRRFNQQLKAMIREGKEALGTKFEVEEYNEEPVDEGYAEEGSIYASGKG